VNDGGEDLSAGGDYDQGPGCLLQSVKPAHRIRGKTCAEQGAEGLLLECRQGCQFQRVPTISEPLVLAGGSADEHGTRLIHQKNPMLLPPSRGFDVGNQVVEADRYFEPAEHTAIPGGEVREQRNGFMFHHRVVLRRRDLDGHRSSGVPAASSDIPAHPAMGMIRMQPRCSGHGSGRLFVQPGEIDPHYPLNHL